MVSLVHIGLDSLVSIDTPLIEVVCQTINYAVEPKLDEYMWKQETEQGEIFDAVDDDSDEGPISSESRTSSFSEKSKQTMNLDRANANLHTSRRARRRDSKKAAESQAMNKRPPDMSQRSILTRGIGSSDNHTPNKPVVLENYLSSYAEKMSKRYQEKSPPTRHIIMISLPDDSFQIESIVGMLNGNMMDPTTKAPTPIYQEIALLLKLGTECMAVYRDERDSILMVYFKRLKNESLDSSGHQFSIVQTSLEYLRDKRSDDSLIKLKLLLKDISTYISKAELVKKLSYRGQNRHYFVFTPDSFKALGKKSIAFKPAERQYELNYEDWTMDRFGTYGTINSVVQTTIPSLSYCLFFDFDFSRTILAPSARLSFHERYEQILRTAKGESFVLDSFNTSEFSDYLDTHKTYYQVIECIIQKMKRDGTIIKLNCNNNYLLFDIGVMETHLKDQHDSQGRRIEEWFKFSLLSNKAVFYTAINRQFRITNILDLPPGLMARLGCHTSAYGVFGLLAYQSQHEYTMLIKSLLMPDSLAFNATP